MKHTFSATCVVAAVCAVVGAIFVSWQPTPIDAQAPAEPGKATPLPPNPKPEADDPNLIVNERTNVNTAYVKRLEDFRLTNDFILERADRRLPEGITFEESEEIRETLAGATRLLEDLFKEYGLIDTATGDVRVGFRVHRAGEHAMGLWTLLACGASPSSKVVREAVEKLLDLAIRGDGGMQRIVELDEYSPGYVKPRVVVPKGYDKLDTHELFAIIKALEALAHARLNHNLTPKHQVLDKNAKLPKEGEYRSAMPLLRRSQGELRASLNMEQYTCVKEAVKALLFRQNDNTGFWPSHVNERVSDGLSSVYAVLALHTAWKLAAWTPDRKVFEPRLPSLVQESVLKLRVQEVTFVPTSDVDFITGRLLLADTAKQKVEARCLNWTPDLWSSRSGRSGHFDAFSAVIAIRDIVLGGKQSIRGGSRTKALDQGITEALACHVRYMKPTGPNADKVERPEEVVASHLDGDPRASCYDRVVEFSPLELGATVSAYGALFTGNDTFGHCEWMPDAIRANLEYLKFLREYKSPEASKKETKEQEDLRQKILEANRRKFTTERMTAVIFLSLCMDKVPVWKKVKERSE